MATKDTTTLGKVDLGRRSDRSEHDSSVGLTDFLPDAKAMSADQFAARHGGYYFVRWIFDGPLAQPAPLGSAKWRKMTNIVPSAAGSVKPFGERARADTFFVYPLVFAKGRALSIGRAHTCNVCISDMSVSTQHAEIELVGDEVSITDRGSTNGTVVAGEKVEFGDSAVAKSERVVKFGNVQLTFMTAAKFTQFVLAMCGASR